MANIIDSIQQFGNLINVAFLASMWVLLYRVYQMTLLQRNAQIDVMREKENLIRERLSLKDDLSTGTAVEEIKNAKEFYELKAERQVEQVRQWHKESLTILEAKKHEAISEQKEEYERTLQSEIEARNALATEYEALERTLTKGDVLPIDICGDYSVSGWNPKPNISVDTTGIRVSERYYGTLRVSLARGVTTFRLKWIIPPNTESSTQHIGTGVLVGNTLSAVFRVLGDKDEGAVGVAVYEIIGPKIMRGKWTAIGGDFTGTEECRKLDA